MAKGSKIGEAYVDIRADADRLEADLRGAKGTVERETAEMGKSVEKNVAGKFQEASSKVTSFIGAATGILAVAALANRLGDAIGRWIVNLTEAEGKLNDFRLSVQNLSVDQLTAEIDKTIDGITRIEVAWQKVKNSVGFTTERQRELQVLQDEYAVALEKQHKARLRQIEEQRVAQLKATAENRQRLIAENQALEDAQLTGIERIAREEENARRAVLQRIAETEDQLTKNALERRLELIKQIADAQRDALAEQEAREKAADEERARRAEEAAQKQADALANALTGAYERISAQQRISEAKTLATLSEIQRMLQQTATFQGHQGRAR